MKKIFILLLSLNLLIACNDKPAPPTHITVINNTDLSEPIIVQPINDQNHWFCDSDSTNIPLQITEKTIFSVKIPDRSINLALVVNPNESVKIILDETLPNGFQISGSAESKHVCRFLNKIEWSEEQMREEMISVFENLSQDEYQIYRAEALKTYNQLHHKIQLFGDSIIRNNPHYLSNLMILEQYFGDEPLFGISTHRDLFITVAEQLKLNHPENAMAQRFIKATEKKLASIQQLQEAKLKTSVGHIAPDITLKNNRKKEVSLYETPGEYHLIVFWQPTDYDSNWVLAILNNLRNKYNTSYLGIYAVNTAEPTAAWNKLIEMQMDHIIHVCDPSEQANNTVLKYGIDKPYTFVLLDKQHQIIARSEQIDETMDIVAYHLEK